MTIKPDHLFAMSAWAAVLGGAMRIASAFIPFAPQTLWLEILYAIIDVLLLVATLAIYLQHISSLGVTGLLAAAFACIGFASIIGPDPIMFGVDFYYIGAGVIAVSTALLGVQLLGAQTLQLASVLWLVAFAFALAFTFAELQGLLTISGVSFGAAYMVAGLSLIRENRTTG